MAVAEELVQRGHRVTVLEVWPRPGGLLIYGIAGFKLNKEIVWHHLRRLEELGAEFRLASASAGMLRSMTCYAAGGPTLPFSDTKHALVAK